MAYCEVSQDQSAGTPAAAGDFGFKVLTASDPAEKTKKLNAELANGRLAMMAIIGMFFQESRLTEMSALFDLKISAVRAYYVHIYIDVCMYVYVCMYMYVYVCICMYIFKYVYM